MKIWNGTPSVLLRVGFLELSPLLPTLLEVKAGDESERPRVRNLVHVARKNVIREKMRSFCT